MRVFVAGVIQGSRRDETIEDQSYREQIVRTLRRCLPEVDVIEPHSSHLDRFDLGWSAQREIFLRYVRECAQADLLIAYLPEASMGTAMEMWEAFRTGVPVLVVSPMRHSWAIRAVAARIFDDLDALLAFLGANPPSAWIGHDVVAECGQVD